MHFPLGYLLNSVHPSVANLSSMATPHFCEDHWLMLDLTGFYNGHTVFFALWGVRF